jgi:hypothetical protein
MHVGWTNLPLRPIFLPLVVRLTTELAGIEDSHRSILAGRPIELQFVKATEPLGVEVVPPSGEIVRLKTESASGKTGQEFRYPETYDIGIYLIRLLETDVKNRNKKEGGLDAKDKSHALAEISERGAKNATTIAYSANVDPREFDPTKMDRDELEKRYAPTPIVFAENADDLSGTFRMLREGKSLWSIFLAAVLLFLVFETFLSNRR